MDHLFPIATPPWKGLGKRLEKACRKALLQFQMVDENTQSIAVALSGGKDSLTLLYLLHAISNRGFAPFKLYAIHVAGEFSCGSSVNQTFLQNICNKLDVPLIIKRSTLQTKENLECYSCSRERRKLIFDAAKEVNTSIIAFGHHKDDGIQTLLMNLLQKGEFASMLPKLKMHEYDVTIIRPLILISEEEILEFSKQYGYRRILCQCPVGQNSRRKKVDQLIDEMQTIFPHARNNLAHSALIYGSKKAALIPKKKNNPHS